MLSGNASGQDNRYWFSKNPHTALHGGFLHDLKIGVWWAVSGCETIGAVFFKAAHNNLWILASRSSVLEYVQLLFVGHSERQGLFEQSTFTGRTG